MWARLEALTPQAVVILEPDHVRDVDLFGRWNGARAYGPSLFWRDVWGTPWHEERTLPSLRTLLTLPFEHVLVTHREPVHTRSDFVAALEREPWSI